MMAKDEELRAFVETARRFAGAEVAAMVGTEGPDGDLSKLHDVLTSAEAAGLLASPQPDSPGYDYGVWGRACTIDGPGSSLAVLEEVAVACAGVAACLHFAGLGALEVDEPMDGVSRVGVAFSSDGWRPTIESLTAPPPGATRIVASRGQWTISGGQSLVYAPLGCQGYAVFAASGDGWQRVFVPIDTDGLRIENPGRRTGLAAVETRLVSFDGAPVPEGQSPTAADPVGYLRRYLLGLSAIAVGNARGALAAAATYAAERFQGGELIAVHPAVRLLLGDARSRVTACSGAVAGAANASDASIDALLSAAACRLRVTASCSQAVTDCLQVLGGYGYMEDYRLEKRLRDAITLKSMAPRPDDLRLMLAFSLDEVRR